MGRYLKIHGKEINKEQRKNVLTILVMFFPSLLIAMASAIPTVLLRLVFQVVLLFIQFILITNFVSDYYEL